MHSGREILHRKSLRLPGYDYTRAGGYFVTVVAREREDLFGVVVEGEMILTRFGQIVRETWLDLLKHHPHVRLDEFCIMPNHFHAILLLTDDGRGEASRRSNRDTSPLPAGTTPGSLGAIIQNFKSVSTRRINQIRKSPGTHVWQRNYYEHIIRNEKEFASIRRYIHDNPLNWSLDQNYVQPGGKP